MSLNILNPLRREVAEEKYGLVQVDLLYGFKQEDHEVAPECLPMRGQYREFGNVEAPGTQSIKFRTIFINVLKLRRFYNNSYTSVYFICNLLQVVQFA